MEQMKLEDNIKETLEKRTIQPSATSWNSLAAQLETRDKKKKKSTFWWMGIAASVVAILFTVTLFFNKTSPEIESPILVETSEQVEEQYVPVEKVPIEKMVAETHQVVEIQEPIEKSNLNKNLTLTTNQNVTVAVKKEVLKQPLEASVQKETLEDRKVTEIVAQIQDLKNKGQTVTDADIESLLSQAQNEIRYQTILQEGILTVDANALLEDVESDLQQSFRNKIFEALKNSYETVKTAVAERNN